MARPWSGRERGAKDGRRTRSCARPCPRWRCLVLIAATTTLLTHLGPPAAAQQYGQWSWEGALRAEARQTANELGEEATSDYGQRELRLDLGVNGFIVHPALARFRLSGDFSLAAVNATWNRRNRRWGFGADLELLPRGARTLRLYAGRQLYDQQAPDVDDPLVGLPDSHTNVGGRLRLRRGFLHGSLVGYDHSSFSFEGPARGLTGRERAFWQWDRTNRRFQHHFRLDNRGDDYGTLDYRTRTLTANYDQRGRISRDWRWDSFNVGIRRQAELEAIRSGFTTLRTSQVFTRPFGADSLDLRYEGGFVGAEGPSSSTQGVQARYWWRPGPSWTLAPFGGYRLQRQGQASLRSPQVGLAAHWNGAAGPLGLAFNNSVSYVLLNRSGSEELGAGSESTLALDVLFSARHGNPGALNEELELSWARNRLRIPGELLPELPDLGEPVSGIGTEDVLRGRLTLRWRWQGFQFFGYSEVERRVPSEAFPSRSGRLDRLTNTLQVSGRRLTLTANLGRLEIPGPNPQNVDSWAAALTWRPLRLLSLRGWYRATDRRLALAPDIDIEWIEADADTWVGAFLLRGQWFQSTQARPDGFTQLNRGFTLSLSRRFAGWLPFVTGPSPNGVIR